MRRGVRRYLVLTRGILRRNLENMTMIRMYDRYPGIRV
jgi:hypothetical protein